MKWLQDPNQSNLHNLNNARHEASRHYRKKKREYLKAKINELETNNKNKNKNVRNFVSILGCVSFSGTTLLHGVKIVLFCPQTLRLLHKYRKIKG
jgi:hypothetical protein